MIDAVGLTRSYRRNATVIPVLVGLSLRVARGEFVAVMGASGSGKSTLLGILGLLDRPDGGTYRLDGAEPPWGDDAALSAARNAAIGFVFQQFHLLERATALRNVALPLLYAAGDVADDAGRAERALEAVGLAHRALHYPGELSGGEQQRVAIARALVNDPALILADEPTGSLDATSGGEILDTLRRLADRGRTIVLVTHERAVAERADRVVTLHDGRLTGPPLPPGPAERPGRAAAADDAARAAGS